MKKPKNRAGRRISLALQGGGAHGAFTWGVLDRLLEEEDLEIAAISGTSAGAMNAAALKAGLVRGGRRGARENLDWLWQQIGAVGDMRLAKWHRAFLPATGLWSQMTERFALFSPAETMMRLFSPYDYGPFYVNPLKHVVEQFHLADITSSEGPELFVSATNVRTGRIRVFSGPEITTDAILASTCLPTIFRAIEIDDAKTGRREAYWDGGYTGNPALFPLYAPALPDDILSVQINPMRREDLPRSAQDILERINEVSFNASLLAEFRAIRFAKRLIAEGKVARGALKDVLLHIIADDALMNRLSAGSKMQPTPGLLWDLRDAGRKAASGFLRDHGAKIGHEPSVDLDLLLA